MMLFSRDTGRRVLRKSCRGGRLLLLMARLASILVHMGPSGQKTYHTIAVSDVLNVGAEKLYFLATYQPVKMKRDCIQSSFVYLIVNIGARKSYETR